MAVAQFEKQRSHPLGVSQGAESCEADLINIEVRS